jgi:hypothetical protein
VTHLIEENLPGHRRIDPQRLILQLRKILRWGVFKRKLRPQVEQFDSSKD